MTEITMVPEIKEQWVADLRSGKFPQGIGTLRNSDGEFCCLGVLSQQAVDKGVAEVHLSESKPSVYVFGNPNTLSSSHACLTREIAEWAGVTYVEVDETYISAYGRLPLRDRSGQLVFLDTLNDAGFSFDQIADLIEWAY